MKDVSVKEKLLAICIQDVEQRISAATIAMHDAQESANEESKSSAGDKYETGRAMMQIERDQAAARIEEARKLQKTLSQINAKEVTSMVSLGSVVITKSFNAFIAVGPGKVNLDGKEYFIVTPMSPLGKALYGLKAGAVFTINNRTNTVLEIS